MSDAKQFELIFEGPVDDSAETLRKLRTSLLADLGLSVTEAQEILGSVPKTIRTSEVESDLKPLYAALKKAGGKVLIVRPAQAEEETEVEIEIQAPNEKAYFLDLEDSKLDDDLLKSLEALPGEANPVDQEEDPMSLDLTEILSDPVIPAPAKATPVPLAPPPEAKAEPVASPNEVKSALSVEEAPQPTLEPTAEPAQKSVQSPVKDPGSVPLFEFDTPASVTKPEVKAAPPPAPKKEDLPLFEFDSPAPKAEAKPAPAKEPEKAIAAAPKVSFTTDDLTLAVEEPPAPPKTALAPKKDGSGHSHKAPQEEDSFSLDDLSDSIESQLAEEKKTLKPKPAEVPAAPSELSLDGAASHAKPETAAPKPAVAVAVDETVAPERMADAQPAAAETPKSEEPPPVSYRSPYKRQRIPFDLIVPIVVGAAILGVANWMYFKSAAKPIVPTLTIPDEEEGVATTTGRERFVSSEKKISGKTQEGELSISWDVTYDKEEIKEVTIEAATPKPPELTPEQIVRGEHPPVWLRKIEVSRFFLQKQSDGTWKASGPARVFVEQGQNKRRMVAQTEIIVTKFKAPDSVAGSFTISRRDPALKDQKRFLFAALENGDIQLYVASDLK